MFGGRTSADPVGRYTVLNIKGNSSRLIVKIEYRLQIVFIKHVLTHAEYDKGGLEEMNAAVFQSKYGELLQRKQPRVIRTEEQNEQYIEELERLCSNGDPTPEERELTDLLAVLIEEFEDKHYSLTPVDPLQVIRELMEAQDLKQKDLVDVFGGTSIVSEVLSGKRALTRTHVKRLSQKFHVSPEVFMGQQRP
jgi:HTH-type transcriptional regulator/antitoxin HigA